MRSMWEQERETQRGTPTRERNIHEREDKFSQDAGMMETQKEPNTRKHNTGKHENFRHRVN